MKKYAKGSEAWNIDFYKLSRGFVLWEITKLIGIALLAGIVFFGKISAAVIVAPCMLVLWKIDVRNWKDRQRNKLKNEFKNVIVCLAGNLGAGYALENAFVMALRDVKKQDASSMLGQYEKVIENELLCNVSLTDVLARLAGRSEIDDVKNLANMIAASKRYGGDIIYLIRQYSKSITEQTATQREIETLLAAKRLEGNVMIFAPFAMIIYMRLTNGTYMKMLYETFTGRIIMCVCLAVMLIAVIMTDKIVRIEV